jgi:hypothetical protein
MLAADKQVLDACLRNELQELRRMELENIITRFDSALTPSTLIAGFSFTAIVDLDVLNPDSSDTSINEDQRIAERVFYIAASLALALSLQVTAVASAGDRGAGLPARQVNSRAQRQVLTVHRLRRGRHA